MVPETHFTENASESLGTLPSKRSTAVNRWKRHRTPASPVDALVHSQTLRDLRDDRMAFYQDVLRDWAVAICCTSIQTPNIGCPWISPLPPPLVRGVELAARMELERGDGDSRWRELLDRLSHKDAHGSWRRAVLLATVRSEFDIAPLETVSDVLLADQGRVLRELIGTVLAVDGRSATEFAADEADVPEGLYIPAAPSWIRLIGWLLALGDEIPPEAIPDVARLYTGWCALGVGFPRKTRMMLWLYNRAGSISASDAVKQYDALFVQDADTIHDGVLRVVHRWLVELETARYPGDLRKLHRPFQGKLKNEQVVSLEATLRTLFLAICHLRPSLCLRLRTVIGSSRTASTGGQANRHWVSRFTPVYRTRRTCATRNRSPNTLRRGKNGAQAPSSTVSVRHAPTTSPPSPDHGPFIDLLTHAPKVGLSLVRQIVDYAISHYTEGKTSGANMVSLPFSDGDRVFPWPKTYPWARASQSRDFCLTSALMALREWAKRRVEKGASVDAVLADVIGRSDSPGGLSAACCRPDCRPVACIARIGDSVPRVSRTSMSRSQSGVERACSRTPPESDG